MWLSPSAITSIIWMPPLGKGEWVRRGFRLRYTCMYVNDLALVVIVTHVIEGVVVLIAADDEHNARLITCKR